MSATAATARTIVARGIQGNATAPTATATAAEATIQTTVRTGHSLEQIMTRWTNQKPSETPGRSSRTIPERTVP